MPCYLFTFHAYRSWLPDRPEGFVRRNQGILPPDSELAEQYVKNAGNSPVTFEDRIQLAIIDETLTAGERQGNRIHCIATESSHVHILVSWRKDRDWPKVRNGIKSSLTRRLNHDFQRRKWFGQGGSRKRVKDEKHFDYLVHSYLADHSGWKWREGQGLYH